MTATVPTALSVTLNWYELWMATQVGVKRHLEALQRNLPDRHGCDPDDGWSVHIEGAAGEMAAAKAMNRFYSGSVNTFRDGGDVGAIQVRTRSKDGYELIVRANDRDSDVFVLVVGRAPVYRVMGWMRGQDAKRAEWRKEHGGRVAAYFVPTAALRAMGELDRE